MRPSPHLAAAAALLAALPGCAADPPAADEVARYAEALALVEEDPQAAAARCEGLARAALRQDCRNAAAEALAALDPQAAAALCAAQPTGVAGDECWFQLAERSRDVSWCARAGAFADDCRLHRLSADLRALLPADASPGSFEPALAAALATYGLDPADPRPWSAAYRWVLGRQRPLDRGSCDAVADPARAEACRHTAVALYNDLLNHARDTGTYPCDGGPLPARLRFVADPVLQATLDARSDLCP